MTAVRTAVRTAPRIPTAVLETCGYFLPRLMFLNSRIAPQIHWGDVTNALGEFPGDLLDLSSAEFWDHWMRCWVAVADSYVSLADSSRTGAGRRAAIRSAAACYHWAEFMYFGDVGTKYALRSSVRDCFISSLDSSAVVFTTEFAHVADGTVVPVWILLPDAGSRSGQPLACVLVCNGLDSMTEIEPLAVAETYLERGIAVALFEGPGQGLNVGLTPLRPDMADVVEAVAACVSSHPAVDGDRLGFVGLSFGGYIALRVAQQLDRFQCIVNLSGGPQLTPFPDLGRRLKDDFLFALMRPSREGMEEFLDGLALDVDVVPKARVLSVHGALDDIFPLSGIESIDTAWGGQHELIVFNSEAHVCLNRIAQATLRAADWVHQCL